MHYSIINKIYFGYYAYYFIICTMKQLVSSFRKDHGSLNANIYFCQGMSMSGLCLKRSSQLKGQFT